MRRFVFGTMGAVLVPFAVAFSASNVRAQPTDAELLRRLADLDRDAAHRAAISAPLDQARRALDRARVSVKGAAWAPPVAATDREAALLRSVAEKWLDVARDLVRAVDAEKTASDTEKALDDVQTKIVRERALLEETVARRARTQAQLDALEKPKGEPPPAATPPATRVPEAAPARTPPAGTPAEPPSSAKPPATPPSGTLAPATPPRELRAPAPAPRPSGAPERPR